MLPQPLALKRLRLVNCGLSSAALNPFLEIIRRGTVVESVDVGKNPLGDAALSVLMGVLPPTLKRLAVGDTGCSDAGMMALAEALPRMVHLEMLGCGDHPDVSDLGWSALAEALPKRPALRTVYANNCRIGSDGGRAIAAVLPTCGAALATMQLIDSVANFATENLLREAWCSSRSSEGLKFRWNFR